MTAQDKDVSTPLHQAAIRASDRGGVHVELARLLVERGADVIAQNKERVDYATSGIRTE
jgi:ankyrin repeat protein